jgi:hypothetical protein
MAEVDAGEPPFTEVAATSGLGEIRCHSVGGHGLGVVWADFDLNGFPDLLVACGQASPPLRLLLNHGGTFADITSWFGELPAVDMNGAVVGDVDGDGDPDIYVFTDKKQWAIPMDPDGPPNILYRNLFVENGGTLVEGGPLFELTGPDPVDDISSPPLGELAGFRSKTGGFLDYDADGCLDLYVGHFVGGAIGNSGNRDRMYRNNCDGTFTDVTEQTKVNLNDDPNTYRASLAFVAAQLDHDVNIDMYVVNAGGAVPQDHGDFLFRNNGDGTFTERISAGLAPGIGNDAQDGMGIDVADINNDGNWDIYIGDSYNTFLDDLPLGNVLYLGNDDGSFSDNSAPAAGVAADFTWPVAFFDANQDGYEDLFVGYGGVPVFDVVDFLYMNNQDGTFTDVGKQVWPRTSYTTHLETLALQAHGAAVADYDRDGDLDLVKLYESGESLDVNPPLQLWRNDTANPGNSLQIKLVGCESNRDAVGAVVKLKAGSLNMMRQVKTAMGAKSQNELVLHFGLGSATYADSIEVKWPSGLTTNIKRGKSIKANAMYTIVEGNGKHPGFHFSGPVPFGVQKFAYQALGCGL